LLSAEGKKKDESQKPFSWHIGGFRVTTLQDTNSSPHQDMTNFLSLPFLVILLLLAIPVGFPFCAIKVGLENLFIQFRDF
jgi:hypothetical protein